MPREKQTSAAERGGWHTARSQSEALELSSSRQRGGKEVRPSFPQHKPQPSQLQIQAWVLVRWDCLANGVSSGEKAQGRWPPWDVTYCLNLSYPKGLTTANNHKSRSLNFTCHTIPGKRSLGRQSWRGGGPNADKLEREGAGGSAQVGVEGS